jgi:hypothetical protein
MRTWVNNWHMYVFYILKLFILTPSMVTSDTNDPGTNNKTICHWNVWPIVSQASN